MVDNKKLAKSMVLACVRNTHLEDMHEKYGISNEDMDKLINSVVNKTYAFLENQDNELFRSNLENHAKPYIKDWNDPIIDRHIDKLKLKIPETLKGRSERFLKDKEKYGNDD